MRHVMDVDRVSLVDYLSGDDAYKRLWMRDAQPFAALEAWRRPWEGRLRLQWRALREVWQRRAATHGREAAPSERRAA